MKRILSIIVAVVLTVGASVTAFAATTEVPPVTVEHRDELVVYANHTYALTLGASGDGKRIVDVSASDYIGDIETKNATETAPATVKFTPKNVTGLKEKTERLHITFKEGRKTTKYIVTLFVNPQEEDIDGWVYVDNGVVYSTPSNDEVVFEFEYGNIIVNNQTKKVNLTNITTITEQDYETHGQNLAGKISFIGEANFSQIAKVRFDNKLDGKKVYLYKVVSNKLVQITTKDGDYWVDNTIKPTEYVLLYNEYIVDTIEPEELPEYTPPVVVDTFPENVNENPSTGR